LLALRAWMERGSHASPTREQDEKSCVPFLDPTRHARAAGKAVTAAHAVSPSFRRGLFFKWGTTTDDKKPWAAARGHRVWKSPRAPMPCG